MEKKVLYILLLLGLNAFMLNAQVILQEEFSGSTFPPANWTIDAHGANWDAVTTANAGGSANEARFYWGPQFTGASRFISPVTDLSGHSEVLLTFSQFLDDYAGSGYSLGVATRSGSGPWNIVWEVFPGGDLGPEFKSIVLNDTNVGNNDFQFCIFFNGSSYNLDNWYIDDICLRAVSGLDMAMFSLDIPKYGLGNYPVGGSLINYSSVDVDSFNVNWQVNNGTVHSTSFNNLGLSTGDVYTFLCDDSTSLITGLYNISVWVSEVNGQVADSNLANDTLSQEVGVASATVSPKPLLEEFTSSTCAPCANFNGTTFTPWLDTHHDDVCLIKYQMSWPSPGDPYYTAEGGVRRQYYGVGAVPDLYWQGSLSQMTTGGLNSQLSSTNAESTFWDITGMATYLGNTVTATMNIMPYVNSDITAHIVVIEDTTTGNVMNNGETEFHNVMMKMMPDADGTAVSLVDNQLHSITLSADMSTTNVEEMDDLRVVFFLQDDDTKQILQSAYADVIVDVNGALKDQISVFPNPTTGLVQVYGAENAEVRVFNSLGAQVYSYGNFHGHSIDLSDMPTGTYFVQITTEEGTATRKVVLID